MEPIIGEGQTATSVPAVKEGSTESFAQDVIAQSQETPVIVDFWAPWCGPCKQLGPAIEAAVEATGGAVRLVKINIDENQQLAAQLRVQSIPAVFAFYNGQPVDGFVGAVPDSQIKEFVKRLADMGGGTPADAALQEAEAAFDAEDYDTAGAIFSQLVQQDGENADALSGLMQVLIKKDEISAAREVYDGLSDALKRESAVAAAQAVLELAEQAADAGELDPLYAAVEADENDLEARFELAKSLAAAGNREDALDQLLDIIKRDRAWNEEAARKQLLTLFEASSPGDELIKAARRRLSAILFS